MVQMKISKKQLSIIGIAIISIVVIYLVGTYVTGWFVGPNSDGGSNGGNNPNYDNFAKCLTQKGAVMYGSKYCPHCTEQKQMFGDSFQYVTYVECTEQQSICQNNGVQYVPAWKINGQLQVGVKSLEELADLVGCPIE